MPCAVLFDLDDTLFDHAGCARTALSGVHGCHSCFSSMSMDDFERAHSEFLEALHVDVLAGRIGLDDARRERFRRMFVSASVEPSGDMVSEAAAIYRAGYTAAWRTVEGAVELLARVKARARVGIISNNLRLEPAEKLRVCGLDRFVDVLMVSEEAGIPKPDPSIFHMTLDRLGCAPADAVMVGDSWRADIVGAQAAGIRPIWFNPGGAAPPDPSVAVLRALTPPDTALRMIFDAHRN